MPTAQPTVFVIVYASPSGYDNVYLGFPHAVPAAHARALIREAARLGGWQVREVRVKTEPFVSLFDVHTGQTTPQGREQTIASCVMAGSVDYARGWFRIEPFVRALARYPRLHIAFMVDANFPFEGPRSFGNVAVQVTEHTPSPGPQAPPAEPSATVERITYSYDVVVADAHLPATAFPPHARGRQQGVRPPGENHLLAILVTALGLAALAAAVYLHYRSKRQAALPLPGGDAKQAPNREQE